MFIFSNADGTAATWRFLYSNLCIESLRQCRQFQPRKPIRKTATSHAKQKRQRFHPYRLMFILSNADDTTSTRRFFYSNLCIELFRQCGLIPIMQSSNAKQKRQGFTRICASNCSASADNSNFANPSEKLLHPTQNKSGTVSTHTACCLFFPNADGTTATWRFFYPNLCIESLRQCGHMGDNPHHAIMTGKLL